MAFRAKPSLSTAGAAAASSSPVTAAKAKPTTASASAMAAALSKESAKGLRGSRRRLSVVSDNKLIEGAWAWAGVRACA